MEPEVMVGVVIACIVAVVVVVLLVAFIAFKKCRRKGRRQWRRHRGVTVTRGTARKKTEPITVARNVRLTQCLESYNPGGPTGNVLGDTLPSPVNPIPPADIFIVPIGPPAEQHRA